MLTLFTFNFAKCGIQCNIVHRKQITRFRTRTNLAPIQSTPQIRVRIVYNLFMVRVSSLVTQNINPDAWPKPTTFDRWKSSLTVCTACKTRRQRHFFQGMQTVLDDFQSSNFGGLGFVLWLGLGLRRVMVGVRVSMGSVSDSLGRLGATSECVASI